MRLGRIPSVVALGYAVLGLGASANHKYEVFPFFSWFLFPITPNHVIRYELSPAPALTKLGQLHQMDLHVLIQELGAALEHSDPAATSTLQRRLELNFLVAPCRYTITRTAYDPVSRWTTGSVESFRAVAEFECGQSR